MRYTTVHNRRYCPLTFPRLPRLPRLSLTPRGSVKVVLQHQQSPKNLSKTLHLPSIKDRHSPSDRYNDDMDRPRSYSECGHRTSTLASRKKSRGEGTRVGRLGVLTRVSDDAVRCSQCTLVCLSIGH